MSDMYDEHFIARLQAGLTKSLEQWGLPASSTVSLLTVSENATFKVTDRRGQASHVLRVHRPGYHTEAEIASELAWIEALRDASVVSTPRPLNTVSGSKIARLTDGDDTREVVAFEFMPGAEPSASDDLVAGFSQLGAITAQLHQHARQWQRPPDFQRKTWDFNTTIGEYPHWGHWRDCPDLTSEGEVVLSEMCSVLQARLDAYGQSNERFGLVHADLRLANLLIEGTQLSVIDFDDCGIGWYVYDFAAAISFIEEDEQIPDMLSAWVKGYRSVATLSSTDEAEIPTFIMLRRLMLTAWLATHAETPTALEMNPGFLDGTVRLAKRMLASGNPLTR